MMREDAMAIATAMNASAGLKGKRLQVALDALRRANRASRERHGDDLHEVVKAMAIGITQKGKGV